MTHIEEIRRRVYDLELYYNQVSINYPDGPEKEAKLKEITEQMNDFEKAIFNIETNKAVKLFEQAVYTTVAILAVVALYYVSCLYLNK
jgi:hypothetical protein